MAEEPAVEEALLTSIRSRATRSSTCRNVIGALGLGLVAGGPAGGCMGATAAEMTNVLKDIKINQTELIVPIIPSAHITCMCLLGVMLASAAGLVGGRQAYNVVRRQRWGDTSGKALALAAPVAVLGVAVTGAAVGAILEIYCSNIVSIPNSSGFTVMFLLWHELIIQILPIVLMRFLGETCNLYESCVGCVITVLAFFDTLIYLKSLRKDSSRSIDVCSMMPIVFPVFHFCVPDKSVVFQLSKTPEKMPAIMTTTVLIAISLLRDKDQPVPLVDPAEITPPALQVLERIFVIVFGVQMFQVSSAAGLHSYYVTGGPGKVSVGAVAATAAVLAGLSKVSSMLGTGASLGTLLSASAGAGVALDAAGDLGHRYGGHVGRAGAILGAALGAFLPLAAQNMRFGIMVALCAAAIPGSPYVVFCWHCLYVSLQPPLTCATCVLQLCIVICIVMIIVIFIFVPSWRPLYQFQTF